MEKHDIFVIGASAGGVEVLTSLVRALPANFPGTLFVVLHLPAESPSLLPQILTRAGSLPASHPHDQDPIEPGHIYIAPPDRHLLVEQGYMRVVRGPKENRHRPAIDPLFRSAAYTYGACTVGVILSGMLDDGTAGLLAIKHRGGIAIVQDPADASFPSMPQSALEHVAVDHCLPVDQLGRLLVTLAHEPVAQPQAIPAQNGLAKEVKIAEMETNVFNAQEQIGTPSVFSCPECGGVLWEIKDGDFLRFRCRVGHALSAESVLAEQTEVIDKALWSALKTLDEKVNLSRRLARRVQEKGNARLARHLFDEVARAEDDARCLRAILLNPPLEEATAETQKREQATE